MKLSLFLFLILISCNGQNMSRGSDTTKVDSLATNIEADTIKELGNNIMLVYHDKKNNYWFGSWKDGLYKYDGKTILHFSKKNGFPSNRINEIKEDNYGTVYFNTSDGIVKFDGENFLLLKVADLGGDWILNPDDLWFKSGWDSGFVYRYDGNILHKLQLPKIKLGEDRISKNPNYSNPYIVYTIFKDSKANLWFGTAALGAFRFNGKSFDWILENDVTEIHDGPSNGVRSIIEDKDGYFWFNSLYRYKVYNRNYTIKSEIDTLFYSREKNIGSLDGKKDNNLIEYLSIEKDNNNDLWIATYSAGVWRYNIKNITHYPVSDGVKEINLFSIYKDNYGDLWLGTPESGAYKFNGKTFKRFKP